MALPGRLECRDCRARAPRSQAEHSAAWRWLGRDRRRRLGEGSAQGCSGVQAARESVTPKTPQQLVGTHIPHPLA